MTNNAKLFNEAAEIAFDEEHWQKINYSTGCYESSFVRGKSTIAIWTLKNNAPTHCATSR